MTQLVLISHGDIAMATRDAAFDILGPRKDIHALSLRVGDGPLTLQQALDALSARHQNEPLILLCDIAGGTPANVALRFWQQHPETTEVFTALSLPMVLAYMQDDESHLPPELLLQAGREGIQDIGARARALSARRK